MENGTLKSLLVGAYLQNQLHFLGKVSTGLSYQDTLSLVKFFPGLALTESPFSPSPAKQKNWYWFKPSLTVKIEFMEFTKNLHLRQPVIKGFLNIKPEECVLTEEEI